MPARPWGVHDRLKPHTEDLYRGRPEALYEREVGDFTLHQQSVEA